MFNPSPFILVIQNVIQKLSKLIEKFKLNLISMLETQEQYIDNKFFK